MLLETPITVPVPVKQASDKTTGECKQNPDEKQVEEKRLRCAYCRCLGHRISECRTKASRETSKPINTGHVSVQGVPPGAARPPPTGTTPAAAGLATTRPPLSCYGCVGFCAVKLPTCTLCPNTATTVTSFNALDCATVNIKATSNQNVPPLPAPPICSTLLTSN